MKHWIAIAMLAVLCVLLTVQVVRLTRGMVALCQIQMVQVEFNSEVKKALRGTFDYLERQERR